MRGRHVFMQSLVKHGVRHIFGNPGTTESPLIDSLPEYPQIDYIVALHEGVALGAASFYAQATGRTGIVNLHVAPGLGNALGMLYSALKAGSPMIVTAGQQDTRMRLREPLLGHDLAAMAAPVTKWSVQAERGDELAPLMRRAFKIANDAPAGPVFVALPIDVLEQETEIAAIGPGTLYRNAVADPAGVADVVRLLLASRSPVIVAGDDVARADANAALVALAEQIGAPVWVEGLRHHVSFPSAHPSARGAVPFDAAAVRKAMGDADLVLLTGGPFFEEVWYAAGDPFPDGAVVVQIEQSAQRLAFNYAPRAGLVGHIGHALAAIRDGVAAGADGSYRTAAAQRNAALKALKDGETAAYRARLQKGGDRLPMSMPRVMAEIHAAMPDNVVIVDESITANIDLAKTFDFTSPGDYLSGRGGGIGQGLAGAIGAKVAHPDRPVVAISGDGSAMYSIQALWSAAHHQLAIVFVILVNREYRVLKHNLDIYRQRFDELTNHPYPHMDLTGPNLGFADLAHGMGVAGTSVTKPAEVRAAIERALASGKPHVIEIEIEGKR